MDTPEKPNPAGGRDSTRTASHDSLPVQDSSNIARPTDLINAILLAHRLAQLDWGDRPPLHKLQFELLELLVTVQFLSTRRQHFLAAAEWLADDLETAASAVRRELIIGRLWPVELVH